MTLNFSIEYRTEWGQSVQVELCFLSADGKTHCSRIPLETDDGLVWKGVCMQKARGRQFRYTYIIVADSAVVRREWDVVPRLFPADDARTYFFIDHWRDVPESSHCYSDAYQVATGLWNTTLKTVALFPRTVLFRVQAPGLAQGERVALIGDQPALGDWDVARALPMTPSKHHEWLLSISADGLRIPLHYKYIVVTPSGEVKWEEGDNRQTPTAPSLNPFPEEDGNGRAKPNGGWQVAGGQSSMVNLQWSMAGGSSAVCLSDGEIRLKVPHWKVAGVVVPLFSLRTEGSQGVGDFGDLEECCEWAALAGMHAVQLLPIYDTTQTRTPTDSYPYSAISVHALHPIYADLRRLPLNDKTALADFQQRWQKLNALPALDYVEVIKMKEDYLHRLYEEQGQSVCAAADYRDFAERNAEWLQPYQAFCHLRDTFGTPHFDKWKKLSTYNRSRVTKYIESNAEAVGYYAFVQYILHKQLLEAADHARGLRVFLKGDLPIGISPCSVEAWSEPHLFNTDMVAGAPPDEFSTTGQNWGFPTYNWERMAADGYRWWRQRLGGMAQYFSAYRIDHILGFFRIWSIPKDSPTALLGQFSPALPLSVQEIESYGMPFREELFLPDARQPNLYHPRISVIGKSEWSRLPKYEQDAFIRLYEEFFFRRHNDFWAQGAMQKLPALLDATAMLVCGEDLGMVPACVGPVMQRLGILSLEIQAMPKQWGEDFAKLHNNPYRSVDTIFTHDMPTLRLWWKENPSRARIYYNNVLEHDGQAPEDPSGWLCEEIIAQHLNSPSMLCLISLQDWLASDESLRSPDLAAERINVPANPENYWRYRMHLNIQTLRQAEGFNKRLSHIIRRSGR